MATYSQKFKSKNSSENVLKAAAWEVVELSELLKIAQDFLLTAENSQQQLQFVKGDFSVYLKNLFKKKRVPASHVLVVLVADEQRKKYEIMIFMYSSN